MLEQIQKKKNKIVIGLMSGTSVDGIDVAIVNIKNSGLKTKIKQIAYACYPYPSKLKKFILKNSDSKSARLDEISNLNFLLGNYFADAVIKICRENKIPLEQIDLIGSHGQTIYHSPSRTKFFNKEIFSTMQIADPSVIAKRTGIITVGDFRVSDIAVGGTGAPLVPYFDYVMFTSKTKNRALLNIGGIANITLLPKNAKEQNVFAFDTGPGNMLIDYMMYKLYKKSYDKDGKVATSGTVNKEILDNLMSHNYFNISIPKSCGREIFGEDFIKRILQKFNSKIHKKDWITTLSEFTALSIYKAYKNFIRKVVQIDELIVSGGGVHNKYLMSALTRYFSGIRIKTIDDFNISSDAKEAICFAFLANETISGNCSNMLNATGAKKKTVLGKICLP